MIEKMPEIVAANVEVIYWNTDNILDSLTSVKRLSLCLPSESPFPTGEMFHQLAHVLQDGSYLCLFSNILQNYEFSNSMRDMAVILENYGIIGMMSGDVFLKH